MPAAGPGPRAPATSPLALLAQLKPVLETLSSDNTNGPALFQAHRLLDQLRTSLPPRGTKGLVDMPTCSGSTFADAAYEDAVEQAPAMPFPPPAAAMTKPAVLPKPGGFSRSATQPLGALARQRSGGKVAPLVKSASEGAAASEAAPAVAAKAAAVTKPVDPAAVTDFPTWELVHELQGVADEHERLLARQVQDQPLEAQIGVVLQRQNISQVELFGSWFKDGESPLFKREFRKNVAHLLGAVPDPKKSDALFDALDTNQDGRLDLKDLKAIFKRLHSAASNVGSLEERVSGIVGNLRSIAAEAETMLGEEEEIRRLTAELPKLMADQPLAVRLGEALAKKKMNVFDFRKSMDENNDDTVTRGEWIHAMSRVCQLSKIRFGDEEELGEIYDELDDDGNGNLDTEEMRVALKTLQQRAEVARVEVVRRRKGMAVLEERDRKSVV